MNQNGNVVFQIYRLDAGKLYRADSLGTVHIREAGHLVEAYGKRIGF